MGTQQVLRAAAAFGLIAGLAVGVAHAAPAPDQAASHHGAAGEHVAVIDLGPADDGAVRAALDAKLANAGLVALAGDGLDAALAGIHVDADAATLAAAMSEAKRAFGELDCTATVRAAREAIGISAARQAAGIAVPELPRALAYTLLCADRTGDTSAALIAAARLRELGGSPDVSPQVMAKYPDIDVVADRDQLPLHVDTDVAGAALWVDFEPAGTAPADLVLGAGEHIIAAASGTKRNWISGTAVRGQTQVTIAMTDQVGKWNKVADRVASWNGAMPAMEELAALLVLVDARVALVRHGDNVEAWGHAGRGEPLRRLGDAQGIQPLAQADRVVALVVDRVATWNDRAPDPDVPLLVESPKDRTANGKNDNQGHTKWWVYAVIGAAIVASAIVVYAYDNGSSTQQIELHYP
jgi:hypothetical protein